MSALSIFNPFHWLRVEATKMRAVRNISDKAHKRDKHAVVMELIQKGH